VQIKPKSKETEPLAKRLAHRFSGPGPALTNRRCSRRSMPMNLNESRVLGREKNLTKIVDQSVYLM
jgi:hypothetical protein